MGAGLSKPRQISPEAIAPTSVQGPLVDVLYWSLKVCPVPTVAIVTATFIRRWSGVASTVSTIAAFSAASAAPGEAESAFVYHR